MKKRLRKKLHLNEFAIFGFEMHIHCDGLDDAAQDALAAKIMDVVFKYEWECYGILQQLFIYEGKPGQDIAGRKEAFLSEIRQIPGIGEVHAKDVIDAWNGPSIEMDCDCGCCNH